MDSIQISLRLTDFLGCWSFERRVQHEAQPEACAVGTAYWRETGAGAEYVESAELRIEGHPPMQAERRYLWTPELDVLFEDGRYFHAVPPTGGVARHWCDPDEYRVQYDFSDWPEFETIWHVNGPRKSYVMTTRYRRGQSRLNTSALRQ